MIFSSLYPINIPNSATGNNITEFLKDSRLVIDKLIYKGSLIKFTQAKKKILVLT